MPELALPDAFRLWPAVLDMTELTISNEGLSSFMAGNFSYGSFVAIDIHPTH
jgi:hypothetical protein